MAALLEMQLPLPAALMQHLPPQANNSEVAVRHAQLQVRFWLISMLSLAHALS